MSGSAVPLPDTTGPAGPYWEALNEGRLTFQKCRSCGQAQLPPREECTACLSSDLAMQEASGKGELISWIVYHRPYHPAFADRVPYNVAIVELAEGPRLTTNIMVENADELSIGLRLNFQPESRFGIGIATFRVEASEKI